MPHGVIRKHGGPEVVGTWSAGPDFLTVETAHPDLRRQADRILTTPILIPQHPAQKFVQADETTAAFEPPARQRYLLLFMAEMEAAGYELEQLYDEDA